MKNKPKDKRAKKVVDVSVCAKYDGVETRLSRYLRRPSVLAGCGVLGGLTARAAAAGVVVTRARLGARGKGTQPLDLDSCSHG